MGCHPGIRPAGHCARRRRRRRRRVRASRRDRGRGPELAIGGVWFAGQEADHRIVIFHLAELGVPDGINREWFTTYFDETLLETALTVPHLVAIIPAEFAGDARTFEAIVPPLHAGLFVEVEDRSADLDQVLRERSSS